MVSIFLIMFGWIHGNHEILPGRRKICRASDIAISNFFEQSASSAEAVVDADLTLAGHSQAHGQQHVRSHLLFPRNASHFRGPQAVSLGRQRAGHRTCSARLLPLAPMLSKICVASIHPYIIVFVLPQGACQLLAFAPPFL